jgi:prophage regulatory protein
LWVNSTQSQTPPLQLKGSTISAQKFFSLTWCTTMTVSFSEDARTDGRPTGEAHLLRIQQSAVSRPRSLRLPQVVGMTGLKKTTIYALQKAGQFPHSVPLTTTAVGWLERKLKTG